MREDIVLKIHRRDAPGAETYVQEFRLPYRPNMNVIACLMEIARNPVDASGKRVSAPVYDAACLEEVCGSCTILVNGKVRQACSTLVDQLPDGPIELAPMKKFPGLRDLVVDRKPMFDALIAVKGWIPIDGTHDLGPGPRRAPADVDMAYIMSRCMTCGCCMEACPNYDGKDPEKFIGPQPLGQAYYFGLHPTGQLGQSERLAALMEPGGIAACGNAQNCVEACPKEIPLTEAIAHLNKAVNRYWLRRLFGARDKE